MTPEEKPKIPSNSNLEHQSTPPQVNTLKNRLRKNFKIITALLITLASIAAATFVIVSATKDQVFISPLADNPTTLSSKTVYEPPKKEKIGFLPFWNMKEEPNIRYHQLTQLAFFALAIDAQGNIQKLTEDGYEEPGWTAYKSQTFAAVVRKAKESGTKVILTIQAFDTDTITAIVSDTSKRTNVINQTIELINNKNLDGINIDFEYAGTPNYQTTKNFTRFVEEFNIALKEKNQNYILNVDVFADSSTKVRIWDIPKLAESVDQIIIMAYDFHRPSSPVAAPVAPIRGSPDLWEYDIVKTIRDFTTNVSPEKIILGVPYYGYEWRTTNEKKYAPTYPGTGALATFKRIQQLIKEQNPILGWDEQALSPRLTYNLQGKVFQIYYDNETSLGIKYDLVNESGLAGIAIWAIGYDGTYPNLWNLLSEKFPN